jgi:hypothetical protein
MLGAHGAAGVPSVGEEGSMIIFDPDETQFYIAEYEEAERMNDLSAAEYATNRVTLKHIKIVRNLMQSMINGLRARARQHDQSKLDRPEVAIFTEYTPKLAGSTYGSDEYKQLLAEMKPALDHHYAHNSHHPEHFPDGVDGMTLLDVVEMLCDWKAATLRHNDGDIRKSLEINTHRFNLSPQLARILRNTVDAMGW